MAANECTARQPNIPEGPQARVLFFGGASVSIETDIPSTDVELKRYANEHDYRCGALISGTGTPDWLKEQDIGIVSLPGMTQQELSIVREQLSPSVGIGIGENAPLANRPAVIAVNGVRLGVLSLNETTWRSDAYAVEADIEDLSVYDHVRMLLPQCDHVIVFCRTGLPGFEMPLPEWRERYRHLIESGASIVLGVRSDEPLGWEEYGHGVAFYGIGTLTRESLAVSVTFERNGRFTYESRLLEAIDGKISFSADDTKKEAINAKNALLVDEAQYLDETERACVAFYQAEGYTALLNVCAKRGALSGLLRKKQADNRRIDEAMLKDLLVGTSRRYAVLRALNATERTKDGDTK